jgi:hypothetical protein
MKTVKAVQARCPSGHVEVTTGDAWTSARGKTCARCHQLLTLVREFTVPDRLGLPYDS